MTTNDGSLHKRKSKKKRSLGDWEQEFVGIIDPQTSSGRLVFAFVRRQLHYYHLEQDYSESYILHEVFLRGRNQIDEIENLCPWIKGAARLVIKELSRKDNKLISLTFDCPYEGDVSDDWEEDFEAVRQALKQLPTVDERLLNLKIVEKLSWAEICDIMRVEGHGDASEATWRKRKERALSRLRKLYHQIKPPF